MADMPHADLLRSALTGALETDTETLKAIFGLPENADIVFRPFDAGGFSLCAVYTEGMAQSDKVADFILRACHAFDAGAEAVRRKRGRDSCSKTPSAYRRRAWKSACGAGQPDTRRHDGAAHRRLQRRAADGDARL